MIFNKELHPSFKEQFDKLSSAYIAGQINPLDGCACFIGNMFDNHNEWMGLRCGVGGIRIVRETHKHIDKIYIHEGLLCIQTYGKGLYSPEDIINLETLFLNTIEMQGGDTLAWGSRLKAGINPRRADEDALFIAFEKTLEALKELHISKGEVIDEVPVFKKRELQLA